MQNRIYMEIGISQGIKLHPLKEIDRRYHHYDNKNCLIK
jgi:hypothetical protein